VLGVMRAEGSMESEPEALKALAIAIRTYALRNGGRHAKDGYDFCSTTHCQRFALGNSSPAMIDAVRTTEGQVLTDDRGQPVDAYFGASCGGETANIGTLWGMTPPEYLRGVHDEYCLSGPHATWTDVISRADLLRALQSDDRTDVGTRVDQVIVSRRDETGRAEFITLDGEHRKSVRGWDFKIIVGRVLGWNLLKSSRFEVSRSGSNFIFRGRGFGHGLGLCQEGAHVMAARGASYSKILEKYFPGTRVNRSNVAALPAHGPERLSVSDNLLSPLIKGNRSGWIADLLPGLPIFGSAPSFPDTRLLAISSEHFRVTYPADVDRRDANQVLTTLETARADFLRRANAASISVDGLPTMEIRLNESTGDFTARTGQPWWAAAATKGNRIELQPVGILKRRSVLTTTLRHEMAHVVIDKVSQKHAPRWLEEGFALYLAGEGATISRYATKAQLTTDQLEKKLERPGSQQEMRSLYAAAYQKVFELMRESGEVAVWKRLSAN
jgi:stage II sporulation protein D